MTSLFEQMADIIPEGASGAAVVKHHVVTPDDAKLDALRGMLKGYRPVAEGKLCQLFVNGTLMMSDGANEHASNRRAVQRAAGDVLIAGLGIGMILVPILRKPEVTSVTVVELHAGVIDLVALPLSRYVGADASKLAVINADIFEWKPPKGARFQSVYLDIWVDVNTDNLKEITKLKRRFGPRVMGGGWLAAWQEDMLRSFQRRAQW